MYGRSGIDFFFSGGGSIPDAEGNPVNTYVLIYNAVPNFILEILIKYFSIYIYLIFSACLNSS